MSKRTTIRQGIRAMALAALMTSATIVQVHASPYAQAPHTPAPADPTAICHLNSGPKGEVIGALYYVREVMDDAIIKYEQFQKDQRDEVPHPMMAPVETHNDYLCDVRSTLQGTLEFMTVNILIWMIDYIGDADAS